jgi:thymidylate kinase
MLNTKLILIEGLPGAGKSTSTAHLGGVLRHHGIACHSFLEEDEFNPIACLDFEIKGLTTKMVHLWRDFAEQATRELGVTIIESRLWQNTALFMFMSDVDLAEIVHFNQQVGKAVAPLSPCLIYLDQDDTEIALRRMYAVRGENWMEWALGETIPYPWFQSRGLKGFAGWVQFFEEWQHVAERLYSDWPYHKIKILNPHEDWARAYDQMYAFLQV